MYGLIWLGNYNKINNQHKIIQKITTFIIHFKDGHRKTYGRDAAWNDVYTTFPNADYIEEF